MTSNYRKFGMKKPILALGLTIVSAIILAHLYYINCGTTDEEAIVIAKNFYSKMGVVYSSEHLRVKDEQAFSLFKENTKKIIAADDSDNKFVTKIDCKNKELVHFSNTGLLESVWKRYTVKMTNAQKIRWTSFIDEKKAKEILMLLAKKLSLPDDAEFSGLKLDNKDGMYIGKWKKKYRGFSYEQDYITIWILAANGEFYAYNKNIEKIPYLPEVKITRSEAIKIAQNEFKNYFNQTQWTKNKDIFEIKSAELYFSKEYGFLSSDFKQPRLVWVVVLDAKEGMGRDTVQILIKDKSVIKIDPSTGKVLSKKIEIVR